MGEGGWQRDRALVEQDLDPVGNGLDVVLHELLPISPCPLLPPLHRRLAPPPPRRVRPLYPFGHAEQFVDASKAAK